MLTKYHRSTLAFTLTCAKSFFTCVLLMFFVGSAYAEVKLAWDPSLESNLAGYTIYRSQQPGVFPSSPLNGTTPLTLPSYTDSTTQNGNTYYYVVRAVSTNGLESDRSNEVHVAVAPVVSNTPPVVNSVPNQTITLPATATLTAIASDDGLPNGTLNFQWTVVSGSGVTLTNSNSATAKASFSAAGAYTLRITVSDGQLSAGNDFSIQVLNAPLVTLLASSEVLKGSVTSIAAFADSSQVSTLTLYIDQEMVQSVNATSITYKWDLRDASGVYLVTATAFNQSNVVLDSKSVTVTVLEVATISATPGSSHPGETVTVSWSGIASPTPHDWIGLYQAGAANEAFVEWAYVNCAQAASSAISSGSCSFALAPELSPGTYQLRLLADNGYTVLATSNDVTVTVTPPVPVDPSISATPSSTLPGDTLTASWSGIAAPTAHDWIGLYPAGAGNNAFAAWKYVSCSNAAGGPVAAGSCSFALPVDLAPGTYQLRLLANNGNTVLATSNDVTVTRPAPVEPSISATPSSTLPGDTLTASWSGIAAPTARDWIGLYPAGAGNNAFAAWKYVSCSNAAGGPVAAGSCSFALPADLAPGTYQLRLLADNTYTVLATSNDFTVNLVSSIPFIRASPASVPAGGTLTATWKGTAYSTTRDWIGMYSPGDANTAIIAWMYVGCSKVESAAGASGSCPFAVPANLSAGTYELRLLENDGFQVLAISERFTVTVGNQ